jgi:outer membrane protein assembly factor BamB
MFIKRLGLMICLFAFLSMSISAQKIYQWRNEDRNGIYHEKNLLKVWPTNGPELVWEYQGIGNGYGSPVFTNDRMYVLGEIDTTGFLFAFDLKGKLLWKSSYGQEWVKTFHGSRSAPTIVDSLIYVCSGLGNITCFSSAKGEKRWFIDMLKDLHGSTTMHGHSESLAVDDDKVFLTAGGNDTNVVAFDRFTGKIKWICKGLGERPAYNSPNIIHLKNRNILVTFSAYALMGIDTKTGELLWTHVQNNLPIEKHGLGMGDTHSNTVIFNNGFIYYDAGDGNCAVKLKLSDDGKSITEVWRNTEPDNFMGGIVLSNNYIYTSGNYDKDLKSIDANTGETTSHLLLGSGSTIMADSLIYFYNQKGIVSLVDPNPEEMKLISSFKITKGTGEHFSHPVINNGKLYIRHGNVIMAYSIIGK